MLKIGEWKPFYLGSKNTCKSREDKGDREGLPHTHTIPQVILRELFLELG